MAPTDAKHVRKMTRRLLEVFDADFVPGGYSSREIPWEIGATMHGSTARLKMLWPSEKAARDREARELDDAREAMGRKRRRKPKQIKDKIR